jgi:hypothetical protein
MAKQSKADLDGQIDAWQAKYGDVPEEPYAEFMEFDQAQRLMILRMSNGRRVVIPLEDLQGLAEASPEQLVKWEMLGVGHGMEWPELGVSFSISSLLQGSYGNQLWMRQLQARGGASRSEAKRQAARVNGAKGGRPSAKRLRRA